MTGNLARVTDDLATSVFPFRIDSRFRLPLLVYGVTASRAEVRVDADRLRLRFGPWSVDTPLGNISHIEVTGPYRWWKAIGIRMSLVDRGITFGTTPSAGICLQLSQPVSSPPRTRHGAAAPPRHHADGGRPRGTGSHPVDLAFGPPGPGRHHDTHSLGVRLRVVLAEHDLVPGRDARALGAPLASRSRFGRGVGGPPRVGYASLVYRRRVVDRRRVSIGAASSIGPASSIGAASWIGPACWLGAASSIGAASSTGTGSSAITRSSADDSCSSSIRCTGSASAAWPTCDAVAPSAWAGASRTARTTAVRSSLSSSSW